MPTVVLPNSGKTFLPSVPKSVYTNDRELYEYLQKMNRELESMFEKMYANDNVVATIVSTI